MTDDRIFFHANHLMKVGKYYSVIIASLDKDLLWQLHII